MTSSAPTSRPGLRTSPQQAAVEVVAVIPAGASLPAGQAALDGMGQCYPPQELSLRTDPTSGAMLIVRSRATSNLTQPQTTAQGHAQDQGQGQGQGTERTQAVEPDADGASVVGPYETQPGNAAVALGAEEIGDLLTYAFTGDQDGVSVIAAWMARLLDSTEGAANFVTFTMNHANGQRYAMTVQRVDGLTPAEKIAALEQQVADLMA